MAAFERIKSGLPGFDEMVEQIRLGDNVVWQVSNIEEYRFFVEPFVNQAQREEKKLIYMRFGNHPPLFDETEGITSYHLEPEEGFELFTMTVRNIITREGLGAYYVFDCLSDLQVVWATDLMMGNFFRVTCPYLFELNTVAYFPILRGRHSFDAVARIRETTQLFLDVYSDKDTLYVNPLKVWNRYSNTMFLPHQYEKKSGSFFPLKDGFDISRFYQLLERDDRLVENQDLDSWDRFVFLARMEYSHHHFTKEMAIKFARQMMTKDERVLNLVLEYMDAQDYFQIQRRMIGTGGIGGKACGMLLSRAIVAKKLPKYKKMIEPHDSFYVGSDVFYTYIVYNGYWKTRMHQKTRERYFSEAEQLQDELKNGKFPENIQVQFRRMLEYYGSMPLIVRSSSLQEDGFGNAFAGKYESVFCLNQGDMDARLAELENAVRTVYASTMDRSALEYRRERGLEELDEQMAVLIQRVSGDGYGDFFMPGVAGVGYSYSAYRWEETMDPKKGMLRLVLGLGTRAVDRTEGDYPRIVSLDKPNASVYTGTAEKNRFSQNMVDVIGVKEKGLVSRRLSEIEDSLPEYSIKMVMQHDTETERMFRDRGIYRDILFANCQGLVEKKRFIQMMEEILQKLQTTYDYPVDIEFTVNWDKRGELLVNLLQCRPLQIGTNQGNVMVPQIENKKMVFRVNSASMGGSRQEQITDVIWVDPKAYYAFPYARKDEIARAVGAINLAIGDEKQSRHVMLFVPGRIGTSSPDLGVPVVFADIHHFSCICEVSDGSTGYMPELSYGSHMFQDLVETGIFYTALFENERTEYFDRTFFDSMENELENRFPTLKEYKNIIKLYDVSTKKLQIWSDICNQVTVFGTI